jgi:hypothetical protein
VNPFNPGPFLGFDYLRPHDQLWHHPPVSADKTRGGAHGQRPQVQAEENEASVTASPRSLHRLRNATTVAYAHGELRDDDVRWLQYVFDHLERTWR